MKIAILDDNRVICHVVQSMLELAGHQVSVHYESGTFVSAIIQQNRPTKPAPVDLVIVDLYLPGPYSGAQVLHTLKMAYADLPAILYSATESATLEAAAKGLSGVKVLRKPFKLADLMALIPILAPT